MLKTNLKLLKPIILGQLTQRLNGYFKTKPEAVKLTIVTGTKETELINLDTGENLILKNIDNDFLVKKLEMFLNAKINCIIATVTGSNFEISFFYETATGQKLNKVINF